MCLLINLTMRGCHLGLNLTLKQWHQDRSSSILLDSGKDIPAKGSSSAISNPSTIEFNPISVTRGVLSCLRLCTLKGKSETSVFSILFQSSSTTVWILCLWEWSENPPQEYCYLYSWFSIKQRKNPQYWSIFIFTFSVDGDLRRSIWNWNLSFMKSLRSTINIH